ncbi:MAG: CPBP family glutamic-type intramembrane protease [Cyanobacteria bacterium P01_H01_bin.15]
MFPKTWRFRLGVVCLLAVLAAIAFSYFAPAPDTSPIVKESDYAIAKKYPFNRRYFYPIDQNDLGLEYRRTEDWVGRLILPTEEELAARPQEEDWVWFEVYTTPRELRRLVGRKLRLSWLPRIQKQQWVDRVTTDIAFTPKALKAEESGVVVPHRLDGRSGVGPLMSLAGARPANDVIVGFSEVEASEWELGHPQLLELAEFPILVPERFYGLVKLEKALPDDSELPTNCPGGQPCGAEFFEVRHYNPKTQAFDGRLETIRIPQVPSSNSGRYFSTPRDLVKSPAGEAGWYIYGAIAQNGYFTVTALKPRALMQLKPDQIIRDRKAAEKYLTTGNWQDTPEQRGQISQILISSSSDAETTWKIGDRALLIHLFGGIGGENGDLVLAGTVTGHFAFGMAEVVKSEFTGEPEFKITYEQVYAQNGQGIISGKHSWSNYMGHLQRGWLGSRPVSDILVKFRPLDDYEFNEILFSPLKELDFELGVMTARYRTGNGTGISTVSPWASCVQDSSQGLYIAIQDLQAQIENTESARAWLDGHPRGPETERLAALRKLGHTLEAALTPQGVVRKDWQHNAAVEVLSATSASPAQNPFIEEENLSSAILSWRSMLPRNGHDNYAEIFLNSGAELWFLRTNQVGGNNPDMYPLAPTHLFGDVPILSKIPRRIVAGILFLPTWRELALTLALLLIYGGYALWLGTQTKFLQWRPVRWPGIRLLVAFFICFFSPALWEEFVFRLILLPHPGETVSVARWIGAVALSIVLFVIYHPLAAKTFYPRGNPVFFSKTFWVLAGLLGLVCSLAYLLTSSIWAAVIIHWLATATWLYGLGGYQRLEKGAQVEAD